MQQAKKNDMITLEITGYGSDGAGISHLPDGRVVFVRGAMPGETCRVRLEKVGKSAAWAVLREILVPSPQRAPADCPYYPRCGGCQTRHMLYEEELNFKRDRVEQALRRIGGVDISLETIHGAAETTRYRNKAQFPVAEAEYGPYIGFYRAKSHEVVDVKDCLLQPLEATRLREAVWNWMRQFQIPAYNERLHHGLVRHVFVRTNQKGESLCALTVNGDKLPHEAELIAALREAEPGLQGLVLSVNREKTNVILGREFRTLCGVDALRDTLCGLEFQLSVPSFYQVNRAQTELLYQRALDFAALTGDEMALDLYCGIGTITLALAGRAKKAIGAEIVPEAIADAKENATRNGVTNADFFCADAAEIAARFSREGLRPDVITVDPPRKGLAAEVVDAIVQMKPARVVYVSCDPGTLARDVKRFGEQGYRLEQAEAFDLFPRTVHVETVVLLSRKMPDDRIDVNLDLDELDATAAETKATYKEIKEYVLRETGLKVSSLYISQVKRKCGLEVGENYHLAKSENAVVPQCPQDKEEAIRAALKHFAMI